MAIAYRRAFRNIWLGQPATAQGVVPEAAGLALPGSVSVFIEWLRAQNRSGSTSAVAVLGLLPDSMWEAGKWVNATTTYTADTADAQSAATNDFALNTLTTVNDGFLIGADVPFGAVSVDVTTAEVGPTAHVLEYWDGAAWTAIAAVGTLIDIPRAAVYALGEKPFIFDPPSNWTKGGSGTGVPQGRYNARVRHTTTAATTAGLARRLYVGELLWGDDAVVANGFLERKSWPDGWKVPEYIAALGLAVATADEGNNLELLIRV